MLNEAQIALMRCSARKGVFVVHTSEFLRSDTKKYPKIGSFYGLSVKTFQLCCSFEELLVHTVGAGIFGNTYLSPNTFRNILDMGRKRI